MSEGTTNVPPREPTVSSDLEERSQASEEQIATLRAVTLEQIESITKKLYENEMIKLTPCELTCILPHDFNMPYDINCYMKFETLQHCGSCKARGAAYAILRHREKHPDKFIVSASLGNFAIALCYYASQYEISVIIVMPKTTPLSKIIMCERYLHGCNYSKVIIQGKNIEETVKFAMDIALCNDMIYIGEDHPDVIIGQATIGLEILEEVKDVDVILVPITSGALIAGVAMAVKKKKPTTLIIGIESEMCPSFSKSCEADKPVVVPVKYSTLTDELAIPKIGINAFSIANTLIDDLFAVKEDSIAAAMLQIIEHEAYTVEGSGAMGLAAILYGGEEIVETCMNKNVVLLLSDGNLDPTVMEKCIQIGLHKQKRLLEFTVQILDEPKYLENLIDQLTKLGVFICKIEYYTSNVEIICEIKNISQANVVEEFLNNNYTGWSGFRS